MIEITRAMARQFRAVLRKSAPLGAARSNRPSLVLQTDSEGLRLRGLYPEVAVEWHLPGYHAKETLALPTAALDNLEGRQETSVTLTVKGDAIQAEWEDGGIVQSRSYSAVHPDRVPPFPAEPAKLVPVDLSFLKALDDAAQVTVGASGRYALTKISLRGSKGEIVSTNSRHLLIQRGFPLPWNDDVLVSPIGVFGGRDAVHHGQVELGKTDTHVCIRLGPWTFYLAIDTEARFPRIEQAIPAGYSKGTKLQMAPEDANFLAEALPRLPCGEDEIEQVTVDLNGHVAVRAKEKGQPHATELLLNRSSVSGPPSRFVTNRQFLARAVKLGFADLYVTRPDAPIVCRDRRRLYVWVPLNPEVAIPPSLDAHRIESATSNPPVSHPPIPVRSNPMPAPQTNGHATHAPDASAARGERAVPIAELINEAEELRTIVADVSTRLARLLTGLKQHRRQSRAVQAAMQSLKQLQLDG